MPLSEKVRIETYLPDINLPPYLDLLAELDREFTHAFGGCTVIRNVEGNYLSRIGIIMPDRISLIYADMTCSIDTDFDMVSQYADEVRLAAMHALGEEAILVVVYPVYHSQ